MYNNMDMVTNKLFIRVHCKWTRNMYIEIDFNSDETIYSQLKNRIILAIAMEEIRQGESLPSVRDLALQAGINMHTVNKAYAILRDEGYLTIDRKGAVINVSANADKAKTELYIKFKTAIAGALSKNLSKEECRQVLEEVLRSF